MEIINQFYFLFENVYKYVHDLNEYLNEVEDGKYIEHTLETMFLSVEGKQLLVIIFIYFMSLYCMHRKHQSWITLLRLYTVLYCTSY